MKRLWDYLVDHPPLFCLTWLTVGFALGLFVSTQIVGGSR